MHPASIILQKLTRHKFLLLIFLYFLTRLINLTLLPIFNDEAIYLHWGWIEVTRRDLFYSLFDGKQPFLMWLFGYSQKLFQDPLYAGRIISVCAGFLTLIGIYEIGKKFFSGRIAFLSAVIYIITPVFFTYDRLALMESSISAIGVWLLYWYLRSKQKPRLINSVFIGFIIGIGLFIKSSGVIFVTVFLVFYLNDILKTRNIKLSLKYILILFISIGVGFITLHPLVTRHDFHKIIDMNSRYSMTLYEISFIPYTKWYSNALAAVEISFWHLSPGIFLLAIIGTYIIRKKNKNGIQLIPVYWLLFCLAIFVLTVKSPSSRYLVSILPVASILSAVALHQILNSKKLWLASILPVIGFIFTLVQLINPFVFFELQQKITAYSDSSFINNWTSGGGINEAIDYLSRQSRAQTIDVRLVGVTGNPDDALFVLLRNRENIKVRYAGLLCAENYLNQRKTAAAAPEPIYLITRDDYLGANTGCLKPVKKFYKPDRANYIGIYTFISE